MQIFCDENEILGTHLGARASQGSHFSLFYLLDLQLGPAIPRGTLGKNLGTQKYCEGYLERGKSKVFRGKSTYYKKE